MSESSRIAKNTMYLYIRLFITMVVSLYTSRVVLQAMGFDNYGLYGVVGGVVSMFTFLNGVLSNATSRYITFAIGTGDRNAEMRNFSAAIVIHVVLAALILIVCETVGLWFINNELVYPPDQYDEVVKAFHISIATALLPIVTVPFTSMIIAHEKMSIYAWVAIIDTALKLAIAYVISHVGQGHMLSTYAWLMLLSGLPGIFINITYCLCKFKARFTWVRDRHLYRQMLSFASWTLFGNVAYLGYTQGLNMLLNIFFGPAVNAARNISVQMEATVRNFTSNFLTAINPPIIKAYARGDLPDMHRLMFASSKFSFILMLFFSLPILFETETILNLWLHDVPPYTPSFFRIMVIIMIMETMSNSLGIGANATGRIKKYHVVVGLTMLTIVPISYLTLKLGGNPLSIYVVYASVNAFACCLRLIITSQLNGLSKRQYFYNVVVKCAIGGTLSILPLVILHNVFPHGILRLTITLLATILIVPTCCYFCTLNKSEQEFIKRKINSVINIIKNVFYKVFSSVKE